MCLGTPIWVQTHPIGWFYICFWLHEMFTPKYCSGCNFKECWQGWHIGIGRYEISADIAHIGKTDISVSVITPTDIYRPICNIGNPFHIGGYRSKSCIISAKNHCFMTRNNFSSYITVILMPITWQKSLLFGIHTYSELLTQLSLRC